MKIIKVINNNVVSSFGQKDAEEVVIMGKVSVSMQSRDRL